MQPDRHVHLQPHAGPTAALTAATTVATANSSGARTCAAPGVRDSQSCVHEMRAAQQYELRRVAMHFYHDGGRV